MVGDYNVAAGSWSRAKSGGMYAVMVFVKACGASAPPSDPGESVRVSGADRYATAAALSAATFGANVPVAYVATGANFPDALAAGPAAAHAGGPVLLVATNEIPASTAKELAAPQAGRGRCPGRHRRSEQRGPERPQAVRRHGAGHAPGGREPL